MVGPRGHSWGWHLRAWFGPGVLFLAGMTAFFLLYDPFLDTGPNLIQGGDFEWAGPGTGSSDFPAPAESWTRTNTRSVWKPGAGRGGSGGIEIGSGENKGGTARLQVDHPERFDYLRVTGWMKTEGVELGSRAWFVARIVLYFRDREGKGHYDIPHSACYATGTHDWFHCDTVFGVPDFAADGQLLLQNLGKAGTAWFDEMAINPVQKKGGAVWWRVIFTVGWTLFFLQAVACLRLWKRPIGWAILGVVAATLAGVTLSMALLEEVTDQGMSFFENHIAAEKPASPPLNPTPPPSVPAKSAPPPPSLRLDRMILDLTLHKSAHGILFAALGFVVFLSLCRTRHEGPHSFLWSIAGSLGPMLLFAIATEILQFPTASRSPRLSDILINSSGIAAGLLAAWMGVYFRKMIRQAAGKNLSGKAAIPGGPPGRG